MNLPGNYIDVEQGSSDWLQMRLGCVTSSRIADAVSFLKRKSGEKEKGQETQARANLRMELMCELLTGLASEHYVSRWMEEGKEKEPLARGAYEIAKGVDCDQIGFVLHNSIKFAGASPDSLVGNDGLVEFKCPKTSTHLKYIIAGVVPEEYKPQMYWQMACCERDWCDFVSHDPSLKRAPKLKTFLGPRLYRDEEIIREMESKVVQFNQEVQEAMLKLDPDYIETQLRASLKKIQKQKIDDALGITEEDIAHV